MKLEITEPCTADWNAMKTCGTGKHCELCRLTVIDGDKFSDSDLYEMLRGKEKICLRISVTRLKTDSLRIKLISAIENLFLRFDQKRIALYVVTAMFFLAGCRSKQPATRMGNARFLGSDNSKFSSEKNYAAIPKKSQSPIVKNLPVASAHFY
ncbi:MAG: hypothetical protein IAF38_16310 [Bacteroidia bacterium]|nr:hypothetical protein [Bacteroidia bacterium]